MVIVVREIGTPARIGVVPIPDYKTEGGKKIQKTILKFVTLCIITIILYLGRRFMHRIPFV